MNDCSINKGRTIVTTMPSGYGGVGCGCGGSVQLLLLITVPLGNYYGPQCQVDGEVLAVAVGASVQLLL